MSKKCSSSYVLVLAINRTINFLWNLVSQSLSKFPRKYDKNLVIVGFPKQLWEGDTKQVKLKRWSPWFHEFHKWFLTVFSKHQDYLEKTAYNPIRRENHSKMSRGPYWEIQKNPVVQKIPKKSQESQKSNGNPKISKEIQKIPKEPQNIPKIPPKSLKSQKSIKDSKNPK